MRHTILLCALLLGIFCWALPQQALADDTYADALLLTQTSLFFLFLSG